MSRMAPVVSAIGKEFAFLTYMPRRGTRPADRVGLRAWQEIVVTKDGSNGFAR